MTTFETVSPGAGEDITYDDVLTTGEPTITHNQVELQEVNVTIVEADVSESERILQACAASVDANVALVRKKKKDYYDMSASMRGTALSALAGASVSSAVSIGSVNLAVHDVVSSHAGTSGLAVGVGTAFIAGIAGGLIYSADIDDRRPLRSVPVVSGYALECVKVSGVAATSGNFVEDEVVVVALPQIESGTKRNMRDLIEVTRRTKADYLVLPSNAIADSIASQDKDSARPLAEILDEIKGGDITLSGKTLDTVEGDLFQIVRPAELAVIEVDELKSSLKLLLSRFPDMTPLLTTMPTSSADVRQLARQLRPIALRSIADHIEPELYSSRDEEGVPLRTKLSRFIIPNSGDDDFAPSVSVQYATNPDGMPAERRTLASFVPDGIDIKNMLSKGSITTAEVLPVVNDILVKLEQLDKKLRSSEKGDAVSEKPVLSFTQPAFEQSGRERHNPQWRKSFNRMVGATVLGAALLSGLVNGKALLPPPNESLNYPYGATGVATVPETPDWLLEDKGITTSGYYSKLKYYELTDELNWTSVEHERTALELPLDVGPVQPHIAVTGYFQSETTDDVILPIKRGTEIGAIQITDAAGEEVSHDIVESKDGGVYVMFEGPQQRTVEIQYDLVAAEDTPGATSPMTIGGLDRYDAVEGDSTNLLVETAELYSDQYQYDNTSNLNWVVNGSNSPQSFYERSQESGIANCNTTATALAIYHVRNDSNDQLAYTTGYLASGKYLRQGHAWLTNNAGLVIDGTPPIRQGTADDAGIPSVAENLEDLAWSNVQQAYEADVPVDLPLEHVPTGILGLLALGLAGQSVRHSFRELSAKVTGHGLTTGQAHHIIAHTAFDDSGQPPYVNKKEAPLSLDALPFEAAIHVAANSKAVAPYLSWRQRLSLRRHARAVMTQHVDK